MSENMKCSICRKEGVTLIVPPDKPIYYCLECICNDLTKNWQVPEEANPVLRILHWLEGHGRRIPEAKLTIGKPQRVLHIPRPPQKLGNRMDKGE